MIELTLLVEAASGDAVSDALIGIHGALSVSVEDADAGTDAERAWFAEPGYVGSESAWTRTIVKALFADAADATQAATSLLADAGAQVQLQSITPIADLDWVKLTQAEFASTEVASGFWIVPTWHAVPALARRVIRLDPGMAFGTGTHPTTRMCLRWISNRAEQGLGDWPRVLDYGCGSGILAIGAALHGAREIDAVDIDAQALAATAANAAANDVVLRVGPPESMQGTYALVLANILATPLKLLAPLLCAHLDACGELVLAGILERQGVDIIAAYRSWIDLSVGDSEDGWVLMTGQRSRTRMA